MHRLRSDLERRKRAEAEVAAERDRLEDLLRRCDADLDEERAAAREALLAVELVEEALRASGAHDDFGSDNDGESWAGGDLCGNHRVDLHAIDAKPDASLNCREAAGSFRTSYGW